MALSYSARRFLCAVPAGRLAALGSANRHRPLHGSAMSGNQEKAEPEEEPTVPKIVVFGGRGFVGSHICKEALNTGLHVVGISKSGTPPISNEAWVKSVEWLRGNLLEPKTYERHLTGAVAAISAVGAFGNTETMLKINGTANVMAVEACKAAGIPRFVYISATIPQLPGIDSVIGGYIRGKQEAEQAVLQHYPEGGVVLRPGVVYGDRVVSHSLTLPLGMIFQPLEMALSAAPSSMKDMPVIGSLMTPPMSAAVLARAAVAAATDGSQPAGIMDVSEIQAFK